ncbi:hypothetical protein MKW94_013801 [Papaver nudicaule]|uniref:Glutamate receptor n=1 Tax=Papaver nudicaule TaxID=74823 RepID=A0AA41RXV9_PAPNU|nr:hypothetical protein [Papaver nudicaule]
MIKAKPICLPKQNRAMMHALLLFIFFSIMVGHETVALAMGQNTTQNIESGEFKVGVVLDSDSLVSKMGLTAMSMALSDFYSSTNDTAHKRKLVLYNRDSRRDIADAAFQASDLMNNVGVEAIIGPLTSLQAIFLANLGNKAQVPIISFTATSPSVSTSQNPYFIRTTQSDLSQVNVIAELVKTFGWREVVPIYENTEYGKGVMPDLIDAFQAIDTRVPYRSLISPSATDGEILGALYKLMGMRTRVFVVHMTPALGVRIFQKAKIIGMMSEGYSWIITDGLANMLGSFNSSVIDSMQGVLGVRPYVPRSIELDEFRARWRKQFMQDNPSIENPDLNIFCLRAYDTIWAIASVLDKLDTMNSSRVLETNKSTAMGPSGVSQTGPELLQLISETKFHGLSGEFNLVDRELESNTYQLLNVIGNGDREVGIWTTSNGIARDWSSLNTTKADKKSSPRDNLRVIVWPGESVVVPRGWVIPEMGKKLKIGVPVKQGFTEFVKVTRNNSLSNSSYVITGYCIDVFKAVIEMLPYPVSYELVPFAKADGKTAGSYDDLIYQVYTQNYDAVVGDITISGNRSTYVDFTLPYTPSGFSMIVPLKEDTSNSIWILLKPLNWNLWVAIVGFFILTWSATWALEREEKNPAFQGEWWNQLETMFWFFFSTPAFAEGDKTVRNGMAKVVVIVWAFSLLILSSSYTASLTSMLTVHRLEPTVTDVHELIKTRQNVGYLEGTFVYTMLKRMGFNEANLKPYISTEDFKEAFTASRSKEDRIVAAFGEAPFNRLLLAKYCHKFALAGPMYKTGGFGFAFPRGSPLVPDISRAISHLREDDRITRIEQSWFGNQKSCSDPNPEVFETSLNFDSFMVLFIITGIPLILAFVVYLAKILLKGTSFLAAIKKMLQRFRDIWQSLKEHLWQCLINFWQCIKDLWHRLENLSQNSTNQIKSSGTEKEKDNDKGPLIEPMLISSDDGPSDSYRKLIIRG